MEEGAGKGEARRREGDPSHQARGGALLIQAAAHLIDGHHACLLRHRRSEGVGQAPAGAGSRRAGRARHDGKPVRGCR